MSKICISIFAKNLQSLKNKISESIKHTKLIEIRADLCDFFDIKSILEIKKIIPKNVDIIFTCRLKKFGGSFANNIPKFLEIMKKADKENFKFLDINVTENLQPVLDLPDFQTPIILSYHNFSKTPDIKFLQSIISQNNDKKISIFKFAVKINSRKDEKNMLDFLDKNNDKNLIIVGMGEKGKNLRKISIKHGGKFTFACLKNEKTANGQIDILEILDFLKK